MKNLFIVAMLAMAIPSFAFTEKNKKSPSASNRKTKKTIVSKKSGALAFPVAGTRSKVGSFWGDSRDGGERSHKGIDIFAKKGTPVVAIADGVVVDKGESGRGGKVIWLKTEDHPITAYYAHLDKWNVKEGQRVRKGQVLGTVGNTGNARTTPSHLHFGIYKSSGAVNPLPYVKKATKVPIRTTAKKKVKAKTAVQKKRA